MVTANLSDIVLDAYNHVEKNPTNEYEFVDSITAKRKAMATAISNIRRSGGTSVPDYACGRYSGIIKSKQKAYLIYTGTPAGLDWPQRFVNSETGSFSVFVKTERIADPSCNAFLIVSNPKMLNDIYHDKMTALKESKGKKGKERKTELKNTRLGDKLDSFRIIPETKEGCDHLRRILSTDEKRYEEEMIKSAIESGLFESNKEISEKKFPLRSKDGTLYMLGTNFEIHQLRYFEKIQERFNNEKFGIICYAWQMPYYKHVLKEVNLIQVSKMN